MGVEGFEFPFNWVLLEVPVEMECEEFEFVDLVLLYWIST